MLGYSRVKYVKSKDKVLYLELSKENKIDIAEKNLFLNTKVSIFFLLIIPKKIEHRLGLFILSCTSKIDSLVKKCIYSLTKAIKSSKRINLF